MAHDGDGLPDLAAVRDILQVPVDALSDQDLAREWAAARTAQRAACLPTLAGVADGDWPAALVLGLLRRCAKTIAARNLPLGYLGDSSEAGPVRLSGYDAVLDMHEGPWRKVVAA